MYRTGNIGGDALYFAGLAGDSSRRSSSTRNELAIFN